MWLPLVVGFLGCADWMGGSGAGSKRAVDGSTSSADTTGSDSTTTPAPTPELVGRWWVARLRIVDGVADPVGSFGYEWVVLDDPMTYRVLCTQLAAWVVVSKTAEMCSECDWAFENTVDSVSTTVGDGCSDFKTDSFPLAGRTSSWEITAAPGSAAKSPYSVLYSGPYSPQGAWGHIAYNTTTNFPIYWNDTELVIHAAPADGDEHYYYVE